ncbi:MAG: hypothetical protein ABI945_01720, partial [Nitrospirales bacterium]
MTALAKTLSPIASPKSVAERVRATDWARVSHDLDAQGHAMIKRLLTPDETTPDLRRSCPMPFSL